MDIKAKLKDAREAIKNKDYETSLNLSKAILKEDKDNYMALVFLGLSFQELGPPDQAPKAFQKAVQLNPSNSLAWSGLINYYEKIDSIEAKKELIKLYSSILSLEGTEKKIIEYCQKLSKLFEFGDMEIVKTIFNCNKNDIVQDKYAIYKIVVNLFQQIKDFPYKLDKMYEECLSHVVEKELLKSQYYSEYLEILYKKRDYDNLLIHAEKMYNLFKTETISLVWICKVFNQCFVEHCGQAEDIFKTAAIYYPKLLEIEPQNATGLFSKSIALLKEGELIKAKNILVEVVSLRPGLLHAWVLLTSIYIKLSLIEEATQTSLMVRKLLKSLNNSSNVKGVVDILLIELLSKSSEEENWKEALELYKAVIFHIINFFFIFRSTEFVKTKYVCLAKLAIWSKKCY